jgi:hypothetical protein
MLIIATLMVGLVGAALFALTLIEQAESWPSNSVGKRPIVAAIVVGAVLVFFISGVRHTYPLLYTRSPPFCGPLKDGQGNVIGDAGPCQSLAPLPTPRAERWDWAPFWVASDLSH